MNRQAWVYDIETLKGVFTYVAINIDTLEIVKYVIHPDKDEMINLHEHLKQCKFQIGFNNLNFDYPIIHYFLTNFKRLEKLPTQMVILSLYKKAQEVIESVTYGEFKSAAINKKEVLIKQLDLFKVWHFNNPARNTSLKALQISMNYPNVMECSIPHNQEIITLEELDEIVKYNENDVLSTFEFYKKSLHKIELRRDIKAKYKLDCINFADVKIGEELMLDLYSELTDQDKWEVKKLRTKRNEIILADCILPTIQFKNQKFKDLLQEFKSLILTDIEFEKSVIYKGFKYDYGLGGIHGCIKPGVYKSTDTHIIIDADVASLYPNLAIQNNFFPEHLGEGFVTVYKDIVSQRLTAKRNGEMSISDALKLAANGAYGKSSDKYSFLYDPKFTMSITVNGQLLLTMLAEKLVDKLDCEVLQVNTDGITVKIHRSLQDLYYQICKEWETQTKLELEYVEYSKMIIRDVNNYMAVKLDGKAKYKGAFEIDKEYHKDPSFRIVALAISEYFIKGTPVENTIKNHQNIYDFCGRQKFKSDSKGVINWIDYDQHNNPIHQSRIQQKNVRYYISTGGCSFIKHYNSGDEEFINKGYRVTIFNEYKELPFKEYGINYNFYTKEANKIIQLIENNQLELF